LAVVSGFEVHQFFSALTTAAGHACRHPIFADQPTSSHVRRRQSAQQAIAFHLMQSGSPSLVSLSSYVDLTASLAMRQRHLAAALTTMLP